MGEGQLIQVGGQLIWVGGSWIWVGGSENGWGQLKRVGGGCNRWQAVKTGEGWAQQVAGS